LPHLRGNPFINSVIPIRPGFIVYVQSADAAIYLWFDCLFAIIFRGGGYQQICEDKSYEAGKEDNPVLGFPPYHFKLDFSYNNRQIRVVGQVSPRPDIDAKYVKSRGDLTYDCFDELDSTELVDVSRIEFPDIMRDTAAASGCHFIPS
jgi:hypothetical protein